MHIRLPRTLTAQRLDWLVYSLLLAVTCLLILFTRMQHLMLRTQWYDDSARDVLIAKKIVDSGSFQAIAPRAGTGNELLSNSYLYYNMIAVFWSIGRSALGTIATYTILGCISCYFAWDVGRQVGGKWLGLACLFAVGSNTYMSFLQSSLYQRNVLPSLSLVIISMTITALRTQKMRSLIALFLTFLVTVLLHYSILTFLFPVAVISLIAVRRLPIPRAKKTLFLLLSTVLSYTLFTALTNTSIIKIVQYLFSTQRSNLQEVVYPLYISVQYHLSESYTIFYRVFSFSSLTTYLLIIWTTLVFASAYIAWKKNLTGVSVLVLFMFSYLLTHLVDFKITYPNLFHSDLLVHYVPLVLILLPVSVFVLTSRLQRQYQSLAVLFVCLSLFTLEYKNFVVLFQAKAHEYSREYVLFEEAAQRIVADIRSRPPSDISSTIVIDNSSWAQPGWFSPSLLYFIEDELQHNFVELSDQFNNLRYTFTFPAKVIYLLCNEIKSDTAVLGPTEIKEYCIQDFVTNYYGIYSDRRIAAIEEFMVLDEKKPTVIFRITTTE